MIYRVWAGILLIVLVVASVLTCVSCEKQEQSVKESLFTEVKNNSIENDPEAQKNYNYGKTFVGGTGFVKTENEAPFFNYSGGSMTIEYVINNGGDGFECGITLFLDGVNQVFSLIDKDGKRMDNNVMHIIHLNEKENYPLSLEFTPNIGEKGDILCVSVGTMISPSYTAIYSGYGAYGKFNQHAFNAGSDVTVHMLVDAPKQQNSADLRISHEPIPNAYKEQFISNDKNYWGTEYRVELYTDKKYAESKEKPMVIYVPKGEIAELTLDVFGMEADWRACLFLNHELQELSNGNTYVDFSTDLKTITRVQLPVSILGLPKNNNVYIILFQKSIGNPNMTDGTYVFADKVGTYYFIVNESEKAG